MRLKYPAAVRILGKYDPYHMLESIWRQALARRQALFHSRLDGLYRRLHRPVVKGVNYLRRCPSWSPPKPLTAEEKANLWRLEQARQLLRWWVIEYRHGFLYA